MGRIGRRIVGLVGEAVVAMMLVITVLAISMPVVPVEAAFGR